MLQDGYEQEEISTFDLSKAGINTIIWATGFDRDYSWIDLPILDEWGYPIQERGVTQYPGLYFLGLHWLHTLKSGLFLGVGEDAKHIAEHMKAYRPDPSESPLISSVPPALQLEPIRLVAWACLTRSHKAD
jgi:hypothetical protein